MNYSDILNEAHLFLPFMLMAVIIGCLIGRYSSNPTVVRWVKDLYFLYIKKDTPSAKIIAFPMHRVRKTGTRK